MSHGTSIDSLILVTRVPLIIARLKNLAEAAFITGIDNFLLIDRICVISRECFPANSSQAGWRGRA